MTGWPKLNDDDPPPSLQLHYRAFITTTRQSAPHRRISTFGLAVSAACAFSLSIVGKVLTFRGCERNAVLVQFSLIAPEKALSEALVEQER